MESIYQKNKTSLSKRYPELVSIIENQTSFELIAEPTRTGSITLRVDGNYLHSRHNPEREAQRLIEKELDPQVQYTFFIGLALAYQIEAFKVQFPNKEYTIIEPNITLLKTLFEVKDYSSILQDPHCTFILGSDPSIIKGRVIDLHSSSIQILRLRSVYLLLPEEFDHINQVINETINRREINNNTHKRFSRLWISNICRNIPYLVTTPGVKTLENSFKDIPAILLAAGPSLTTVLEHIHSLRDTHLIVCVDTAVRACLATGVNPDFIVMTDPQYWNTRHLDGCDTSKSIVLSDVSTYPSILRQIKGPLFFCSTPFPLGQYLEEKIDVKGKILSGGSVATAAWDFCRFIGCSEIYCAGLDLSFPDKQTHYRGGTFEERAHTLSSRYLTGEGASWHALQDGRPFWVDDNRGSQVLSDQRMHIYHSWFEEQIGADTESHSFNLSEAGVKIEGMPHVSVSAILDKASIRKDIDYILKSLKATTTANRLKDSFHTVMSTLEKELSHLYALSRKGCDICNEMLSTGIKEEYMGLLDEIDKAIMNTESREIAGFFLQPLLEEFIAGSKDSETSALAVISESKRFYQMLETGLHFHLESLKSNR